ncbi:MAG: trypsin-like peptidase domain-containing protein [Nanoarchaeota archaeon]|nr:trypsin-like peptidase domain-containing protein [Nanoarchaeota archaeon]
MKYIKGAVLSGLFAASLFFGYPTAIAAENPEANKTQTVLDIKDGKYDNHPAYVDEANFSFDKIAESIEPVRFNQTFKISYETLDGQINRFFSSIQGFGSGVVIKKEDGCAYLLTNKHVVNPSFKVKNIPNITKLDIGKSVKIEKDRNEVYIMKDDISYTAEILLEDSELDMALIKVKDPNNLLKAFPYKIGNSDDLELADFTYVIGFPLTLEDYVLHGNVTKLYIEKIKYYTDLFFGTQPYTFEDNNYFMIGSSIIPGYSGGSVIAIRDGEYELVGIVNAALARSYYDAKKGIYVPDIYADYGVAIKISPIMEKVNQYFEGIKN